MLTISSTTLTLELSREPCTSVPSPVRPGVPVCGGPLDPVRAADLAAVRAGEFCGRDGVDAPGWYRVSVLPHLVRRAASAALGV